MEWADTATTALTMGLNRAATHSVLGKEVYVSRILLKYEMNLFANFDWPVHMDSTDSGFSARKHMS